MTLLTTQSNELEKNNLPSKKKYSSSRLKPYLKALRPRQWTKNLIVFAAPLFAFQFNFGILGKSLLAYALFCCISSTFYLINDILDVKSDRQHPVKCNRPIASGQVSVLAAWLLAAGLFSVAMLASWGVQWQLGLIISAYAALQIAYNLKLKHTAILDIIAIAAGFVLRAYGGGVATQIPLSAWFVVCTAMLALFLAIEKRKAELRLAELQGKTSRAALKRYSLPLLIRMESTVTTGTILSYLLWSSGPSLSGASTPWMLLTVPFVLYGIFRYQLLSDPQEVARDLELGRERGGKTERPEEVLLKDRPILLTLTAWALSSVTILACTR
jgi:decaprenyl-phosphate phosphoribosyltransferase